MKRTILRFVPMLVTAAVMLAPLALLDAASAGAAVVIKYETETMSDFQRQLAAGEIHAATFNKKAHHLHLSMNDKRHLLVSYPSKEQPKIAAELQAKGVPVTVEKTTAKTTAAKPVKHTLRYIAGAIVVVVILAIVIVLLIGRRRSLADGAEGPDADAPVSPPPAVD